MGQRPDSKAPPGSRTGTAPTARPARPAGGDGWEGPAGGSKGPGPTRSRNSKDGTAEKGGAAGGRGRTGVEAAAPAAGGGGAGTTTTEPKTDSDTRTSRLVECFFEFSAHPTHPGALGLGPHGLPGMALSGGSGGCLSGLGSSGSRLGLAGLGMGLGAAMGPPGMRHVFGVAGPEAGLGPGRGAGGCAPCAELLDLGKIRSYKELWEQLAVLYDGTLPDELDAKIIYLDEDGDWVMVTPDEPWSSVAAAATKVLVTNRT